MRDYIITDFAVKGQPFSDLNVGQNYNFTIVQTNAISYQWNLGSEGGIQTTASVVYTPKSMGRKVICANVTIFTGFVKSKCFEFYVRNSGGYSPSEALIQYSPEEDVFEGESYGKMIKIGGTIWLQNDVNVINSNDILLTGCPSGFDAPSQDLYNALISSLAADATSTLKRQAFYNLNFTYASSNKSKF